MDPMFLEHVEKNPGPKSNYLPLMEQLRGQGLPVSQIMYLFAYKPERTNHLSQFTQAVMRGPSPLSPAFRELIATFTSRQNECRFCLRSHAAVTTELLGDRSVVDAVLEDYTKAPISDAEKALLGFIAKVTRNSVGIGPSDITLLHNAGWTDEAIYDAITVCALFNFYNRWVHASGVHEMPEAAHRAGGKRLAERGYIPTPAQGAKA